MRRWPIIDKDLSKTDAIGSFDPVTEKIKWNIAIDKVRRMSSAAKIQYQLKVCEDFKFASS